MLNEIHLPTRTLTRTLTLPNTQAHLYYQPLTDDTVLVIDTTTRAVVTQIPVGDNPRGVFMQGNASPKEL